MTKMDPTETSNVRDWGTALTIAGFDPSSGAGCSADLLVFAAHGIFATAAITAMTVQSTTGVRAVEPTRPDLLRETLACLEEDLPPIAIKIGMLASAQHARVIASYLHEVQSQRSLQVVLDPVLRSSSGAALIDEEGMAVLQHDLLPLVDAITPNLREAEVLSGMPCSSPEEMAVCGQVLQARYPRMRVLITGGHLETPSDLLLDAGELHWFSGERIQTNATHGTGCAFSTALLSGRVQGSSWVDATRSAKAFVAERMLGAVPRGRGHGPLGLVRSQFRETKE